MTIENVAAARQAEAKAPGPARDVERSEQAVKNREIADAVKAVNEGGGVGPSSELRFAIDHETGQALIRIVDRVTDEVIAQLPPETAVRAAEVLKTLRPGDRIA